ncbi:MAG: hypothetical protein ABJH52_07065 [Henriciella sp.]
MFPTAETIKLYADIEPLIVNPVIDGAFSKYEARATKSKSTYHSFGQIAVLLIAISAIFAIADALIIPEFDQKVWLSVSMGLIAALGIALQLYLLISQKKAIWLLSRFACERLRSAKFQAYASADKAKDAEELSRMVVDFSNKTVTEIENEINAGVSILDAFRPSEAMLVPVVSDTPKNDKINQVAAEAYSELRISYQKRFAISEIHRLKRGQRYYASVSDMLYLLGAGLVLASLISRVIAHDTYPLGNWIDFLASGTFITAVALGILDHGKLATRSSSRFMDYQAAIENLPTIKQTQDGISPVIAEMETAVLEELRSFSEASQTISYRM